MSIVNIPITENKYLIFFSDGYPSYYFDSTLNQLTTFNNSYWTYESYDTEEEWVARLLEFGIVPEEPTSPI